MLNSPAELHTDLVLVGGGHSHALLLRRLGMRGWPAGARVTLVSPDSHTPYSGMLPGLIAGHYAPDQVHIDLDRLCAWAGVRFIRGRVSGLDPQARLLRLAGRPALGYDLCSLDIGATPALDAVPGAREHAVPVKPVAGFWARWQAVLRQRQPRRIAVVGGGAGGVELVLAMAHALRGAGPRGAGPGGAGPGGAAGARPGPALALYCAGPHILEGYAPGVRRRVEAALRAQDIGLHCGQAVSAVHADHLRFADGQAAAADTVFWCTGAAAAPWVEASGLRCDAQGFLLLRDTLQSLDDPRVFAAGDIGTQLRHPRPKAGVYAVRQAPVLADNLYRALQAPEALGTPQARLREHRPQQRFLSLLSLGRRSAVAARGPLHASGDWVWRWKNHIDARFMQRFAQLPPPRPMRRAQPAPETPPYCGGCGAKVGADALQQALRALRRDYPEHALPDGASARDAVALPGQGPWLQSVDSLRALVDDPYLMGQLTAVHALSDLHAAGAQPRAALAQVTLPYARSRLLARELEQLLAGALSVFAAEDCVLLGGHSLQGPELQLGFALSGLAPAHARDKRGGRPGDRLLLTKPLGSGVLFAARMQQQAHGADISAALTHMRRSNGHAAALAAEHGVRAATDVTGFGLLGHLGEMLGPALGARLSLAALPWLDGARAAIEAGIHSSLWPQNHAAHQGLLAGAVPAGQQAAAALLHDPQTCGGLLLATPPERAPALLAALRDSGHTAADIGALCTRTAPAGGPAAARAGGGNSAGEGECDRSAAAVRLETARP